MSAVDDDRVRTMSVDDDDRVRHLLSLPAELVTLVSEHLLADHLPSALNYSSASSSLFALLAPMRSAANSRRCSLTTHHTNEETPDLGRRVTRRCLEVEPDTDGDAMAVCSVLPITGKSTWWVRIEEQVGENLGCVQIGVCDAGCRYSWSLMPYNGRLMRSVISSDDRQQPDSWVWPVRTVQVGRAAMPPELPDGHDTQALVDGNGRPRNLHRCAAGSVVTIVVDHDAGTLAFGWATANEPPTVPRVALSGFPRTCRLRPWICVPGWCGGRLCIAPYFDHADGLETGVAASALAHAGVA